MKLPALFVGHGDPMIALKDNENTRTFARIGEYILNKYEKPRAILMISGHWYKNETYIQSTSTPQQIFDMYGFPDELYQVEYQVEGYSPLTKRIQDMLGEHVKINDEWGIDHGAWTVLKHMFPKQDIPVVQLSVNARLDEQGSFLLGQLLQELREEGILIMGSGNVVHNLREVDWHNLKGTYMADAFDFYIKDAILQKEYEKVIHYKEHKYAKYAVPTNDHFLPLLYILGACLNDHVTVFNENRELGSMSMTSYLFELK